MSFNIDNLSETRREILLSIKKYGASTASELSSRLNMTGEAVRQHLQHMKQEEYIASFNDRSQGTSGGRPSLRYQITMKGEHLFPKHYDDLTMEVVETIAERLGMEALKSVLNAMTEKRLKDWEHRLEGMNFDDRVAALKNIYLENDSYFEVEREGGQLRFIERNCPFANVAMKKPLLCSVTVSLISRLLGYRVVREERFQNGDGRCSFHVLLDQPLDPGTAAFAEEP